MDKNRVELKTRKTYSGHLLYHFRMPFTQLWQILPVFFRPFVHAIGVGFVHLQGELFNLQFDVVKGSLNKSFIGLGKRFYNVHEVGEAESSLEELDLASPKMTQKLLKKEAAKMSRFRDFRLKTIAKEIPRTEEIDLSHSFLSGYFVRFHLRSRSVHVINSRIDYRRCSGIISRKALQFYDPCP